MVNIRSTYSYGVGDIIKAKIHALNSIGESLASDQNSDIVYASSTPAGQVSNFAASSVTASSIYLTWDSLTSLSDTSYAAILDYKILWNSGGAGTTFTDKVS